MSIRPDPPDQPWQPRDRLGEALYLVRMRGVFYSQTDATAPWGLDLPPFADCLAFHVVTHGHCRLEVADSPPVLLRAGDLALVPHGRGHLLRSEAGAAIIGRVDELPQLMVSEHYSLLRCGGGGAATTLICGVVGFDEPAVGRVLDVLPPVIHVEPGDAQARIQDAVRLMTAELRELRPGGEAVTTRLADILVIEAIRSWLELDPAAHSGWLGALEDPQIGRAIGAVHRNPGGPWTVESLAREAAMSRSAFAARFTELVGESAMRYVTRYRMELAQARLARGDTTVAEVARNLGYLSEASFSRAFTRATGSTPGALRPRAAG
ncbi:AraC family transcriptional regulator [Skermania piniformis]|uniref:AraC family transcriptional regulator n=1 Tax=Skermania pinensis TaxID=39122 RepID=A0ABX8S5Q8_9ACTN|nr:AraC family transcriptional regulator [Skermania piniformis]QXQ12791.1 AraC family transcriptional regulator [Skermania piniformis]